MTIVCEVLLDFNSSFQFQKQTIVTDGKYKFVYIGTILDRGTKNTEGVLGQFLSRAQRARLKNFFKCLGEGVSIYRKIVL